MDAQSPETIEIEVDARAARWLYNNSPDGLTVPQWRDYRAAYLAASDRADRQRFEAAGNLRQPRPAARAPVRSATPGTIRIQFDKATAAKLFTYKPDGWGLVQWENYRLAQARAVGLRVRQARIQRELAWRQAAKPAP